MVVAVLLCAGPAFAGFKRLYASEAAASSYLKSNWNKFEENYHPNYVLDDDPKTAWIEGVDGDGVGESLTVKLSALKSARALKLVIVDGYQKSRGLFAANSTPTRLELTVLGPTGAPSATKELTLAAKLGPQTFEVPLTAGLASVTLKVLAVKPGTRYRDTCISDVQFFVDSDVPYDARVEEARRDKLLKWKQERVAAAKYFASLPEDYPFSATSYRAGAREEITLPGDGKPDWAALLASPLDVFSDRERDGLLKSRHLPDTGRCFDLEALHSLTLPELPADSLFPDGILEEFSSLIRTDDFALSESKRQNCSDGYKVARGLYVVEGTAAHPVRAFMSTSYRVWMRAEYSQVDETYLLEWENGLLARVYDFMGMVAFHRDAGGKIDGFSDYSLDYSSPHISVRRYVPH